MIKLVKFSCGCIGLPPKDNSTWLVKCCDRDSYESPEIVPFEPRGHMTSMERGEEVPKTFVPLADEHAEEIMKEIRQRYYDGLSFQAIKRLLK
jgi:hypothetical protein